VGTPVAFAAGAALGAVVGLVASRRRRSDRR
jgi:MYXO-CTERM domain-containing protein